MDAFIPKAECSLRSVYRLDSRNLSVGVFDGKGFIGIRTKFKQRFLDREYHWDDGPPHGTAKPLERLAVEAPEDVALELSLGSECECGVPVEYKLWPEGGEREIPLATGGLMAVPGKWQHLASTTCSEIRPRSVANTALITWLDSLEG